jgi:hypothetical protein
LIIAQATASFLGCNVSTNDENALISTNTNQDNSHLSPQNLPSWPVVCSTLRISATQKTITRRKQESDFVGREKRERERATESKWI